MVKFPEWIKETIKGVSMDKVAEVKKDLYDGIDGVDKKIAETLQKLNHEVLASYEAGIQIAMDSNLIEIANKLTDSKKQILAFITESIAIREGLKSHKKVALFSNAVESISNAIATKKIAQKDLTRKDLKDIKVIVAFDKSDEVLQEAIEHYNTNHPIIAVRQEVTKENTMQEDLFQVADPQAIGNKVRGLTLTMMADKSKVNQSVDEDYVVLLYWDGSMAPVMKKAFTQQAEADTFYDNYKLKLAEIHKLVQDENIEEALQKTSELLGTSQTITEPVVQDQQPIIKGK